MAGYLRMGRDTQPQAPRPGQEQKLEQMIARMLSQLEVADPLDVLWRLKRYVDLLLKWNRVYNLTAVRNPAQMLTRHILDSLSVCPYLKGPRILDAGTGAGLPGIPLAMVFPEYRFTLIDSSAKKTRFVQQALEELDLPQVEIVNERIQDYQDPEPFDTVIARAFASAREVVEATRHLQRHRVLLMKGVYPAAELQDLPQDCTLDVVHTLQVPGLDAERHLVSLHCGEAP